MNHTKTLLVIGGFAASIIALPAWAANPPGTGQPSQSCQMLPGSPGNAAASPGSVFNEDPGGKAGTVYAGQPGTPSLANGSPKAISQYDVACFQQP